MGLDPGAGGEFVPFVGAQVHRESCRILANFLSVCDRF